MWQYIKNLLYKAVLKLKKPERVDYINGPAVLPPPLTKQEEAELMERLKAGDEGVRRLLIIHNLRLVVYISKKFDSNSSVTEDLISIGTIGLIKAVNTFSPEKNIKLATYASRCIENEILMYLRKTNQQKNDISLDEPLNVDWDGNELLLSDVLGSDPNLVGMEVEKEDECDLLRNVLATLEPRERQIMYMRYGLMGHTEHTQKEVADILGISQSYISRLEKRIIEALKDKITAE